MTAPTATQSAPEGASEDADLFAVVTGDNVDALVGIDVASHSVTRLAELGPNEAEDRGTWGMVSTPPSSVVLSGSTGFNVLVWTQGWNSDRATVHEFDPAAGLVRDVEAPKRGVLPFLYDGELAWASAPDEGQPRILFSDGSFELDLSGDPTHIVEGPGAGRITAVVDPPNRAQRIFVLDVAKNAATELQTESFYFGGVWADDETLVASVPGRFEPTPEDPEGGEPEDRLLTWSIDGGSDGTAAAELHEGPTLRTNEFYPRPVTGGHGWIVAASEIFDQPWVEVFELGSADPALRLQLVPSGFITSMWVSGTTLVVLQERHVTFFDLPAGDRKTVEIGGVTQTRWVER
jgi:hypothetical protein